MGKHLYDQLQLQTLVIANRQAQQQSYSQSYFHNFLLEILNPFRRKL